MFVELDVIRFDERKDLMHIPDSFTEDEIKGFLSEYQSLQTRSA